MLLPGALLQSRYHILRRIGGGGMSMVYLAEDIRLPARRCAVKELSPVQIPPQDRTWTIQTFQQEAHILSGLHHPGLTAVTDYFFEGGNWYLVMDYVDGETLRNRLQREPGSRLSLQEAFGIVGQLCDVLEYIHGQTPLVVFRDLKPDNMMLTPQEQVRLIDFGVARFFRPGQMRDTVNLGTPGYAAPEQYGSLGQTDSRTDIYSLGVLLHQILTGYDPTTTPMSLPSARVINPDLPQQVEAVIQQATQLQPNQRFQSVHQFRQALSVPAKGVPHRQKVFLVGFSVIMIMIFIALASLVVTPAIMPKPIVTPTVTTTLPAPTVTVAPFLPLRPAATSSPMATAIPLQTLIPELCRSTPPSGFRWYVVRPHDTLLGLATRHGTTVEEIRHINDLANDILHVDDCLLLPQ